MAKRVSSKKKTPATSKKRPGRPRKAQPSPETASYSTRFDPVQRDLVEKAAEIKQWSPASLIREAAVTRAAGIVNSSGASADPLRNLARIVAQQVLVPDPDPFDSEWEQSQKDPTWEPRIGRPHDADLEQVRTALETSGLSFVEMILEAWSSRRASSYVPTVKASEVLSGETPSAQEPEPSERAED